MANTQQVDVKERLDKLRRAVSEAKDEKVRLEERFKSKTEEKKRLLGELKKLGVTEDDLDETIKKLTKKRDDALGKAEAIIGNLEATDPIAASDDGEFTEDFDDDDDLSA